MSAVLLTAMAGQGAASSPAHYRAVFRVKGQTVPRPHRVIGARVDFAALLTARGSKEAFSQYSLRVEALDGNRAGEALPFRLDHQFNPSDQSYETAGQLVFVAPDPKATRFAVYFGPKGVEANRVAPVPTIGDGDLLRVAGQRRTPLFAPACYPCIVDFDGDGRRDLVGSDRYGTGARATWFRNIGDDSAPLFSEHEVYPLQTADGQDISNPNRGWMLTVAACDWDGDGKRDLLVGGWCRYLTFHKNTGGNDRPVFAAGRRIFDAKVFPGRDYGPNPDTPYQGVFIEPCDWDGDCDLDLLCGTYLRGRIYLLPNTGRGEDGLPILGAHVALEADGKEIDFLRHVKPSVGDWDGDGDLDLMGGQYYTEASPWQGKVAGIYYFENVGDRAHPKLAAGVQLRDSQGRLIFASFHSEPTMVDWNQDGKMDLLVSGCEGTHLYLRQLAGNNLPTRRSGSRETSGSRTLTSSATGIRFVASCLRAGTPEEPQLVSTMIPCLGTAPCRVSLFAYPLAYDLDRDGTLDLVVGDSEGNVLFFKGLDRLRYAPAVKITSDGKAIDEEGCPDGGEAHRGYVKPAIADFNGDGHADLVIWTNNGPQGWQRGWKPDSWCLKFFAGTADPLDFRAPVEVKAAGQHIVAGYRAKPDVADLDGDGLLDLVVACGHGKVRGECTLMFLKNVGSRAAWELAAPARLTMSDGCVPAVPVRTAARLVDWDGDGDLDLFTGNHSPMGVRYWENLGTKTKPAFAQPRPFELVNSRHRSHHEVGVDAVDLDCDGSLDLLVGNGDSGMVHFFRRAYLESQPEAVVVAAEGDDDQAVRGRGKGFVAEVVRLPGFGKPAVRILTNSATRFPRDSWAFCIAVPAPAVGDDQLERRPSVTRPRSVRPLAKRRIFVAPNSDSGSFTSVQTAIDSVTDATEENPVDVVVRPGSYSGMVRTRDWNNIIGEDRDRCILTYTRKPEEKQHLTHVIWATSNSTIRGLTLVGRDVKYCIHSDGGRAYVLTVEDCVLRREYPDHFRGSRAGFGIGLRGGQHIVMSDCVVHADRSIYMHNWDHQKSPCSMTLQRCRLEGEETIYVSLLGSGQRDCLVLHDCALNATMASIVYRNHDRKTPPLWKGNSEIEVYGSGNTMTAPADGVAIKDDAEKPLVRP